ncbi:ycf20-like protein isoform X3 [Phoenix dactylifera]|uniref:Ycf20-like protein isoform X3 n=1 Tax=Phoenix dactylifera TaxID=42345 RepID=A0A8B8ZB26_PHODC|nr:ycf20-like protein isoform X3 [Phoenix dactylifera]
MGGVRYFPSLPSPLSSSGQERRPSSGDGRRIATSGCRRRFDGLSAGACVVMVAQPSTLSCYSEGVFLPSLKCSRQVSWAVKSMVDDSSSDPPGSSMNTGTRLVRVVQTFRTKLTARIKELKKGLWMKVLFFLVGFYCATAFATVIGQTGDWDILSAGLAVVVVEGIGALMYRASLPLLGKMRQLITIFNYWKAGLSLGLFLDAFKYEMDSILDSCNPLDIEIDMFPIFW